MRPASYATLALAVLLPRLALADTRYQRKTAEVKVGETGHIKPPEAKVAGKPDADRFIEIENEVQDIEDTLIGEYEEAVRDSDDDDPRLLDYMFRLAEAYAQKQRYEHWMAMEAAGKADRVKGAGKKAALAREQAEHERKDKTFSQKAATAYGAMLQHPKFNAYPRADEVLFYLAYGLQHAGRMDLAGKAYARLVQDFPGSKFVPNAYAAIADQYFVDGNLTEAERFYDKVLKFPRHELYPWALYKKGWVNFNQGRTKESFTAWVEVVGLVKGRKDQSLRRAARKDCVRAYAEFGDPAIALRAFQKIDKPSALEMYAQLGAFYLDQGKMDKVVLVFRDLMRLEPKSELVCDWEYTVTRAMLSLGTPAQKVKEVDNLVVLYAHLAGSKTLGAEKLKECRDNAEATTREMAYTTHSECKKTLNPELCGYAYGYYRTYTDNFRDTAQAPEMQFYFAELMWLRADWEKTASLAEQRWLEAADGYGKVLAMKGVAPEIRKEAARALYYAMKNANDVTLATAVPPPIDGKGTCVEVKAKALPAREQRMLAAMDTYLEVITDQADPERVTIAFLKGRLLWRSGAYAEAIPLLEEVVQHHPADPSAVLAANVLMDAQNKSCKFDDLVATARACAAGNGTWKTLWKADAGLAGRCAAIEGVWRRKGCEKLEVAGSWYDAGKCYVEVAQSEPPPADLDEVLFNAGVCFENAKAFQTAINVREVLVKSFPDRRTGQQALYALGANKAAIGEFRESAAYYERYARKFAAESNAPTAASSAVFFRKGSGDDQQALDDTAWFVKTYAGKRPGEAAAAFFSMAGIYEKNHKYDDLVRHLHQYLAMFGGKGGIDRAIIAHVKLGEVAWRQSCPERDSNGSCVKITRARVDKQAARARQAGKRTQCGPDSAVRAVVVARQAAALRTARAEFELAIKLWRAGKADAEVPGGDEQEQKARILDLRYHVGEAAFFLADIAYEEVLGVTVPVIQWDGKGTTEHPSANDRKANARFQAYLSQKTALIAAARARYLALKTVHPFWAVAGAARVGQMLQNYSGQLFATPIPEIVQRLGDEYVDQYCDRMAEEGIPLEDAAVAAYSACLDTSLELNWANDWSRLCERELGQIRPGPFPVAQEIRSSPDRIPLTLGVQPMISEIR